MLGRRQAQPVRAEGELLAVWVSGKLVNTKNARLHHMAEHRYKAGWRERVAMALLEAGWHTSSARIGGVAPYWPTTPKAISIACNVHALMDSVDGLRVACAPITDALKQCGVIDDDKDASGHSFTFTQELNRERRGITIRVALVEIVPGGGPR